MKVSLELETNDKRHHHRPPIREAVQSHRGWERDGLTVACESELRYSGTVMNPRHTVDLFQMCTHTQGFFITQPRAAVVKCHFKTNSINP